MIRYSLIIVLCILLGISSYLLYEGEYIVINIQTGSRAISSKIVQGGAPDIQVADSQMTTKPKVTLPPDIKEEPVFFEDDSGTEIHLDPTVGVDINTEQRIASSYKVIGPRKFALLTTDDDTMVEIDLDTGLVKINPDYSLDEASTEFWKSIGKKYPEVCYVRGD